MDTVTLVLAGVSAAVVVAVVLAGRAVCREAREHDAPSVDEFRLEIELMEFVDGLNANVVRVAA